MWGDSFKKRRVSVGRTRLLASVLIAGVMGLVALPSQAAIEGVVRVMPGDQPLAQAAVTLAMAPGNLGPSAVTVFTDDKGNFRFPEDAGALTDATTLDVRKLGFRFAGGDRSQGLRLEMERITNIADAAPASAWLGKQPETVAKHLVNLHCSGCHQFPSDKVRGYARQLEQVDGPAGSDAKQLDRWRKLVRQEGWRAALKYMRARAFTIFPEGSAVGLSGLPWAMAQSESMSLWTDAQAEIIAHYLADNFPTSASRMAAGAYTFGAPLGVTAKTVIREYALPSDALVREAAMVRGSPFIWGADVFKNRLLRLDPRTNEQKWYPVPYKGATGPHTIVGDADGKVWLSMIDNDQFGRFDPQTESWKLWTLTPRKEGAKEEGFAGTAAVHDISFNADGELQRDPQGRIWLTLIGLNKMGAVNSETGEVDAYDAPAVDGFPPVATSLYGTLLSEDGRCAWFTQLNGYFGCFNTASKKAESLQRFPDGSGPRRMARDRQDIIWVPLYGSGQIVKYDGRGRKILATYDLPDRRAAAYALAWDDRRKALWVTTSNADVLYRFDPSTERFKVYPLPRRQAYFRQLSIDPASGRLVGSYGNIPAGSGPSMAVMIDPGD